MTDDFDGGLSRLEFHVLLSLAGGARYGYAITDAVEEASEGTLTPRAGTLYRVIARLMAWGLVDEVQPPEAGEQHPGRPRRWYALTPDGRGFLTEESRRMAALADRAARTLRAWEP
ncbi:MAG TPA: PadR family transcriptional regulator [Longimicrobiales bacterium]|nr:PadR family transcriptional regulator [Longimicrobiales bacterium]